MRGPSIHPRGQNKEGAESFIHGSCSNDDLSVDASTINLREMEEVKILHPSNLITQTSLIGKNRHNFIEIDRIFSFEKEILTSQIVLEHL